ncbi:MAG: polysaccharide pyruvyl transferase family protein [Lachnospiraceae bacterium]
MKIGVVTVQDSNNFGSFLQAYALQTVLQEMGHEVVFIRSRSKEYIRRLFYRVRPEKREVLHFLGFVNANWQGWKKYRRFQKEQKCFRVIDHYQDEPLDLVILGSDEIWNVQTAVFRRPIFYGAGMSSVMAYAVSIGAASLEDMRCIPRTQFQYISPILARDAHTAEFLSTLQIEAPVVCDPTLLVDKCVFQRPYQSPLLNGQPFLLVYSYGLELGVVKALQTFAKKKNLKIYSACFPFAWCDGVFDCTALDFCAVMDKASYVFTSTYHGTIFSILNHKQFVSLPQSRKTSDLLSELGLSDRLMEPEISNTLLENKLEQSIKYQTVDRKIEDMRVRSLFLLQEGINSYTT